ncbi:MULTISPECIES: chromate efflux transporter [Methylocaldum]|jgi:chromate transporter|uniref:chromate efflux transporter n=1 Tax=unclassified Methylocaldum TaxID=2622260 RepID=UPI00098AAD71|nr:MULTISPECIES: chromate efflux transporter [unclassified Methylocaldum]MBP1149688.1 chromate transporter [Methylocaldum sp. RMAD-M]MDV3241921.1 chromate efflux transporter [Methylocaldum sp.]
MDQQNGPIEYLATNENPTVNFGEALRFWLKLGFISFGGPAGQIAIMHQELVERRRWISERRYLHALNYCMLLPGPEALQLATYIGWLLHGLRGGIAAGVLFILPSLAILILLSWIYMTFGSLPAVAGVLYGIKPAVVAIVVFAAYRIGSRALKNGVLWSIAVLAFLAISVLSVPFPAIILAAALLGALGGRLAPRFFRAADDHGNPDKNFGPSIIDDRTPTPDHARLSRPRLMALAIVGLISWGGILALLDQDRGWQGDAVQMGWFFTKTALLTFGGAYSVLPYVYQGAVEHYHWLTAPQMMDGLALGETTPGPLIMVVTFVGFLAGWSKDLIDGAPLLGGAAGAVIATYFTFLPSFLLVLLGGPLAEATHGNIKFTAPLTGITAAMVGVILNLAVFFAYHLFWPNGLNGPVDWLSVGIALTSATALLRFKLGVIPLIGICAMAGLVYRLAVL